MDEYVKTLKMKIDTKFDNENLNFVKSQFKQLESYKLGILSDKDEKSFEEMQKKLFKIEKLKQVISEIEMFDKDNKNLATLKKELGKLENDAKGKNFMKDAATSMKKSISNFANKAYKKIKSFVESAIASMKEMAEWSRNSNIYNANATSLYMQTGLQGAQAYGLSKALETQGFSSMDDFYEAMPFMTQQQLDYMKEIAELEANQYDESIQVAEEFQNFQKEYDVFKKEMQSELIGFFMDNKSTIKTFMEIGIKAMEIVVKVLGWIFDKFSSGSDRTDSERMQATADILGVSSSSLTNNNYSKNVSISNTYNGVGKTDQSWLANVGQMTYQQIIEALK